MPAAPTSSSAAAAVAAVGPSSCSRLPLFYALWLLASLLLGTLTFMSANTHAQVDVCQANCVASNRLSGPFHLKYTRPHPWKQTVFPSKLGGFCKLGCQLFFAEFPKNTTCKRMCDYYYRYRVTTGYNDLAEEAKSECRDGCVIAQTVCQPGFNITNGEMLPCPPGRYREGLPDLGVKALQTVFTCTQCPPGRYRSADRGKSPRDCTACPIGKYANVEGSVLVSDCKRCPAGKVAQEEGMSECKCMTSNGVAQSCDQQYKGDTTHYYLPDTHGESIDFYRETSPYIGRW